MRTACHTHTAAQVHIPEGEAIACWASTVTLLMFVSIVLLMSIADAASHVLLAS